MCHCCYRDLNGTFTFNYLGGCKVIENLAIDTSQRGCISLDDIQGFSIYSGIAYSLVRSVLGFEYANF